MLDLELRLHARLVASRVIICLILHFLQLVNQLL